MAPLRAQPLSPAEFVLDPVDDELLALPKPVRSEKKLAVALLGLNAVLALLMIALLLPDVRFGLATSGARSLGDLRTATITTTNEVVEGHAFLGAAHAVRFERPMESDTFQLMPVAGRDDLFVELRVPEGTPRGRFVPPASFVGRLTKLDEGGLRHRGLRQAMERSMGHAVPANAYLLVDQELPTRLRMASWLVGMFALFLAYSVFAIVKIARPVALRARFHRSTHTHS